RTVDVRRSNRLQCERRTIEKPRLPAAFFFLEEFPNLVSEPRTHAALFVSAMVRAAFARRGPAEAGHYDKGHSMKPNGEYVTAEDGVRLFVQKIGEGPDVLIIPNRVYMIDAFARLAHHRAVIFCDPRNRGCSDRVTDIAKIEQGIHHDVEDFEAI